MTRTQNSENPSLAENMIFSGNLKLYRISMVFCAILFVASGIFINNFATEVNDPLILRLIIASLFMGLYIATYVHAFFSKNFHLFFTALLILMLVWSVYIAYANHYAFYATVIYLVMVSSISWAFKSHKAIAIYGISAVLFNMVFMYFSDIPPINQMVISLAVVVLLFLSFIIIKSKNQSYQALYESERKFRLLLQSLGEGVVIFDHQYNFLYSNPAAALIFEMETSQLTGKSLNSFLVSAGFISLKDEHEMQKPDFTVHHEIEIVTAKKSKKHLLITETPYHYGQENIKGILGVIRDVTSRNMVQAELRQAKEKAEENDRLKSAFLANMSHEIRTPMNGILGFADLLKNPDLTGQQQAQFISIIEQSGHRMLNIINDLISISKIESGQMEVTNSETNLNERIEFLYHFFYAEASKKGLSLYFTCAFPPLDAYVITDKEKLDSVLINLIKNAIKYTDHGSITFGYRVWEKEIEFFVRDTGKGIPSDKLDMVFERFMQVDSSVNSGYEGAGLGLSISKGLVELMGGQIKVKSEDAAGSEFSFTIPRKFAPKRHYVAADKPVAGKKMLDEDRNIFVLVAEDDDTSANYLKTILRMNNCRFVLVRTGKEAVEMCRQQKFDLVLMDIKMPEMDGYSAARIIREFCPDMLIVAQTAYALETEKLKYSDVFDEYLTKPVKAEELIAILDKQFKNENY